VHEYHILEKIIKEALAQNLEKEVAEIVLSVGDSSGLDPDLIKLYFEQIQETNNRLKDAKLVVQLIKTKLHCPKCNFDFQRIEKSFSCPKCSAQSWRSSLHKDISIASLKFKV
jgi:Zn finger protein HypA/HybF involved in hydrogenase expression